MNDPDPRPGGGPVVSRPDEREFVPYYTGGFEVVLRTETTGGDFFMVRDRDFRPDKAPAFHVHTREEEVWLIHGGTFRFWFGGQSLATAETQDVGPGAVVYGPRNVPHTFSSLDGAGDLSMLWTPSSSQEYFLGVGSDESRDDSEHLAELERVGVHVLDRAPVDGA